MDGWIAANVKTNRPQQQQDAIGEENATFMPLLTHIGLELD